MQRVGRHAVTREIASVGLLATYEASLDGRAVRLRVFDAGLRPEPPTVRRFEEDLARAAGLKHPGIDRPIAWSASSPVHVSTELTRSATLAEVCAMSPGARLEPSIAAGIGGDIAEALSVAHSAGLIHAGLSSESVLVQADGRARVTDFGLMRFLNDMSAAHSQVMRGSIECLAPEQLKAPDAVGPQTDVFGLGLLLYRVLTAKPAFGAASALGMSIRLSMGKVTPIGSHGVEIPSELAALVTKMLSAAAEERPPVDDVVRTLGAIAQRAGPWRDAVRSLAEKAAPPAADAEITAPPAPPAPAADRPIDEGAPRPSAPLASVEAPSPPVPPFAGPPPAAMASPPPRVPPHVAPWADAPPHAVPSFAPAPAPAVAPAHDGGWGFGPPPATSGFAGPEHGASAGAPQGSSLPDPSRGSGVEAIASTREPPPARDDRATIKNADFSAYVAAALEDSSGAGAEIDAWPATDDEAPLSVPKTVVMQAPPPPPAAAPRSPAPSPPAREPPRSARRGLPEWAIWAAVATGAFTLLMGTATLVILLAD